MRIRGKRFLSLALCVCVALMMLPATAQAAINDTFTYDGIKYKVLTETGDTGTVKIDSSNDTSLISADIPQTVQNGGITYTVTAVGGSAFFLCRSLASVTLPDTITEIAVSAFYLCSSLTSIDIPDGVTTIGTSAFRQTGLTSVVIPNGVEVIEMHTFRSCSSLTSVTIPASVTTIKDYAFTDSPVAIIYGYSGSRAQAYAAEKGIKFESLSVAPTIDPSAASFDKRLAVQTDISTVITWNAASSVTGITADGTSIGTDNYSVAGIDADSAMLTIKKEYLAEQETGSLALIIAFDAGGPVTLTIDISDSRPGDATLSDLTVGGFTISGFAADTNVYSAEVPCGARAGSDEVTVGASAANEGAVMTITQAPYLPGSATVLVISEDGSATKTYTVNFTVNGPPGDTRDLLTSPTGGVVKYIYFGDYDGSPLKWRVLGKNTNEVFILSNEAVTSCVFSLEWDNHYGTSYVRSWLTGQFQSGAFSAQELAALRPQRVVDSGGLGVSASEYDLAGDRVFLLSGSEALNSDYFTGTSPGYDRGLGAGHWWLRSAATNPILALFIQADGIFTTSGAGTADNVLCVRPGCKIALSSILLVTAATDGKPAAVGSSLTAMGTPIGDMKLTILEDGILALNSSVSRKTTTPGSVITIPYTGAETGAGHYVSCVIVDSAGEMTHYGKLADLTATSGDGNAKISIPSDTPTGGYTLLLFNEKIMGDYETDYASTPVAIDLTIKNSITSATVSPQTSAIDLYHPDHVQATITWNDAASVSAVTAGDNRLEPGEDFTVTDIDAHAAMLTIKKEYLTTQDTGDLALAVEFDTGESATLTISITDTTPPVIETSSLADGSVAGYYTQQLWASGASPITWSIDSGDLPDGLSLSSDGVISGTPHTAGAFRFTVKAANTWGNDTQTLSITVRQVYTITATAGAGGSISPDGAVSVAEGDSRSFVITPNPKHSIASVTVDGVDQGAISSYTFTGVSSDHTLRATFTYTGGHGSSSDGSSARSNTNLIPLEDLTTSGQQYTITVENDIAKVVVPSNMLTGIAGISGENAKIVIDEGNKDNLPDDVRAAIGDRPLISLTLEIDGKQTDWNNPDAPVTVSIPYTPTTAELADPESIVIWYIDGSGNVVTIPNGRYDAATGTVTFLATHFSDYAVAYNKVSFNDVPAGAWYNKAVSFIAARNITSGTGDGSTFSPDAKLTRGEFIVMMMRAYGISPDANPADNFSDAGNTYYTGYLAAAKRLGITAGVGNNMYAPGNQITRQEMFTLLHNALKVIGQLPQGNSGKTLSDFTDAGQIASWAKDAMSVLVGTGTISGSDGALNPTGTTTRAEMAQVLYNLLGK